MTLVKLRDWDIVEWVKQSQNCAWSPMEKHIEGPIFSVRRPSARGPPPFSDVFKPTARCAPNPRFPVSPPLPSRNGAFTAKRPPRFGSQSISGLVVDQIAELKIEVSKCAKGGECLRLGSTGTQQLSSLLRS